MTTFVELESYTKNTKTIGSPEGNILQSLKNFVQQKTERSQSIIYQENNSSLPELKISIDPHLGRVLKTLALRNKGVSAFQETLKNIISLLRNEDEDEDEEYTKPTDLARDKTLSLVIDAYSKMNDKFPQASAYSDEEGGIRLRWRNLTTNREVRLYCASDPSKKSYVYYEDKKEQIHNAITDKEVGLELNKHLVQWLNWLVR